MSDASRGEELGVSFALSLLGLDQVLPEICIPEIPHKSVIVVAIAHRFQIVCHQLARLVGASILFEHARRASTRAVGLLPTDAVRVRAGGKHIHGNRIPNRIPEFSGLVVKGS